MYPFDLCPSLVYRVAPDGLPASSLAFQTAKTATPVPVFVVASDQTETSSGALQKKLGLKELRLANEDLIKDFFSCSKDDGELMDLPSCLYLLDAGWLTLPPAYSFAAPPDLGPSLQDAGHPVGLTRRLVVALRIPPGDERQHRFFDWRQPRQVPQLAR